MLIQNICYNCIRFEQESNDEVLTTGCERIDKALGGGLFKCGITEISGESGCGKTQFCLQIALTIQLPLILKGAKSGTNNYLLKKNYLFILFKYRGCIHLYRRPISIQSNTTNDI